MDSSGEAVKWLAARLRGHAEQYRRGYLSLDDVEQDSYEAADEIARLTAERDRQYDENVNRIYQQAKAEAARDAIAAAAFERSAQVAETAKAVCARCNSPEDNHPYRHPFVPVVMINIPATIRALTPADAKAALDRMLLEAKAEGMREAAEIARGMNNGETAKAIHRDILGRAKEIE